MAKRRTLQETRGVLLEAGRELVAEFDVDRGESTAGALAHIRAADVANRANLSKGMVYHLWDDQDAYRRDLLIHMSSQIAGTFLLDGDAGAGLDAKDPARYVRDAAKADYQATMNDPTWRLFIELSAYLNDPEVREPLSEAWAHTNVAATKALEQGLNDIGRRVREPLTIDHVVHITRAISRGFRLLVGIDPEGFGEEGFDWEGSSDWSLYAIAVYSVIQSVTEPA